MKAWDDEHMGPEPEVVFVGPKTFPPVMGGIETHVYEISKRLGRKGFRVRVIVPRLNRALPREDVEGVHVVRVPSLNSRFTLKLSTMPFILKELKKSSSNALVHAHDATGGFVAASFTEAGRLIYTMHGVGFDRSDWGTPFRQGIRIMQTTALKKARHVFCTDSRAAGLARAVRGQAETLQNGVDTDMVCVSKHPRPNEYGNAFVFLFVGRMTRVKGVPILLEAIDLMPSSARREMLFVFVGDGPMYTSVKQASKRIPEILAIGAVDHSAIGSYFAHANAYVLPSLSEGLPLSLLEAMAAGLPCIASEVGGVATQIPKDNLMLVPAGRAPELSKAMMKLFEDEALAKTLGERGRRHVIAKCSWDAVVERITQVYTGLLVS